MADVVAFRAGIDGDVRQGGWDDWLTARTGCDDRAAPLGLVATRGLAQGVSPADTWRPTAEREKRLFGPGFLGFVSFGLWAGLPLLFQEYHFLTFSSTKSIFLSHLFNTKIHI